MTVTVPPVPAPTAAPVVPPVAPVAAPLPGSKEHDADLAATFETRDAGAGAPDPLVAPKAERPAGCPEALWDAEKGEVKWADVKAPEAAPVVPPKDDATPPAPGFETVSAEGAKALTDVGLDYAKFAESFKTNGGKLTDADYAEMATKNIPKSVVDAHIAGLQAHATAEANVFRGAVFEVVGGEAKYAELVSWAKTNVPAADLAAFDKVIDTGSVDGVKLAVQGLQSRMVAAQGVEPQLLNGGRASVQDIFESTAQLTDAMKDERYARDPAYRNAVMAKLGRSNIM